MARRASSSVHPGVVIGVIAAILAAIGGGYFAFSTINDPYRTIDPLEVDVYLENANSLRGNIYKISGTVDDQLAWSPVNGRLFSIAVDSRSASTRDIVPVLVPADFNHINIQKGQQFLFQVKVEDAGILKATDIVKE